MAGESSEVQWQARARVTARRFNTAWLFEKLSLPLLLTGLLGAGAIVFARREAIALSLPLSLLIIGSIIALLTLITWLFARRHFTTTSKALVRLEDEMGMNNSLSAAQQGIIPWPTVMEEASDGMRWNLPRLFIPPALTLLILSAAFLLPISAKTEQDTPPEEPANRQALQASLDELREDNSIDEEYLDKIEEKVKELREKPTEEWFEHASLEAIDTLKTSHEQQLQELERNMSKAERALNALQNHSESLGAQTRERLLNEFDQALENMNQGAMKPNKELLEQLGKVDTNQLGNLSPEQLDQLRENMRQNAQQMQNAGGGQQSQGQSGDDWLDELMQEGGQPGNGEPGQGEGEGEGQGPSQGQPQRGPGTAPGVLGQQGDRLGAGDLEGLESRDLSNTLPGDLLDLQDSEHQLDKTKVGVRAGGEVEDLGEGGELIWKMAPNLHPNEKKALREFFK